MTKTVKRLHLEQRGDIKAEELGDSIPQAGGVVRDGELEDLRSITQREHVIRDRCLAKRLQATNQQLVGRHQNVEAEIVTAVGVDQLQGV